MEDQHYNQIPDLNPNLPDEEQAKIIKDKLNLVIGLEHFADAGFELSDEDTRKLHDYARNGGPLVREQALEFLIYCNNCPLDWDDLKAWIQDPYQEIRHKALDAIDYHWRPIGQLCTSDKSRCAQFMAESFEQYADSRIESTFRELTWESREWLEAIWPHIGPLLDLGRQNIYTRLTVGIIEDALRDQNWGPDDPHIREWIEGDKTVRKMSLLAVARWLQLEQDNLMKITEALTQDPDPVIAQIAKAIIADHSGRFELKLEDYQTVKNWLATRDGQE